jgi:hypothetical protein
MDLPRRRPPLAFALLASLLLSACSRTHPPEPDASWADAASPRDAGRDAAWFDGSPFDAAPDGGFDAGGEDGGLDGGACAIAREDEPACPGSFAVRGAPLGVAGWQPYPGNGGAQRTESGWRWLGFVREAPGSPTIVGYRLVETDRHLAFLNTTTELTGLPLVADGATWVPSTIAPTGCDDRWLVTLRRDDGLTSDTRGVLYRGDGSALGPPVLLTAAGVVNPRIDHDLAAGELVMLAEETSGACNSSFTPLRVDPVSLAPSSGGVATFTTYRNGDYAWRADRWSFAGSEIDPATGCPSRPPALWDLFTDGSTSVTREIVGLPGLGTDYGGWSVHVLPRGPALALLRRFVSGTWEIWYAVVDVATGVLLSTPTTLAAETGVFGVVLGPVARDGNDGFGLLSADDHVATGTHRTWFSRVADDGTVLQHTLLASRAIGGAQEPFWLQRRGDRFVAGYSYQVFELVCVP